MRATKTAIAAIVLALGIAIWLAVSAPEKPRAPEPGVTLTDVADAPERFADRKVTLTGRYRGTARFPPAAASAAFVLASGDDELLVMPRPGVLVPPLASDVALRVTGKVQAVDGEPVMSVSHVDNAAPPGLASRIDAVPVGELLDGRAPEGTLFARGEVQALADRRFLLREGDRSILVVSGYPSVVRELRLGEDVLVRGMIERLSHDQAERLAGRFNGFRPRPGLPFLLARGIGGEAPGLP